MKKAIALLVLLLLTAGAASTAQILDAKTSGAHLSPEAGREVTVVPVEGQPHTLSAHSVPVEGAFRPLARPLNIPVADTDVDEYHPTLAAGGGRYLVAYTHAPSMMERNIMFAMSTDGGSSFADVEPFDIEGVQDHPTLSHWGGSTFYGSFETLTEQGIQYLLKVADVDDISTWGLVYWDWSSYEWTDIHDLHMACHNSQESWEYGVISAIASTTYGDYDITNGPHMFFASPETDGSGYISWHDYSGCIHSTAAMDKPRDRMWTAYDIYNDTTGSYDLFYWSRDFTDPLAEGASSAAFIRENYNLLNPSIAAHNDRVAILCQTEMVGNQDISCYYSPDGGESWEVSTVAASGEDELHPAVALSGEKLVCTFIRGGNLYYAESDDWGATWSEPEQLNDEEGTVLSEDRSAAATPVGAIWSDTRDGNSDVYYRAFPVAVLNVEAISGGFGVKATVSNTGTAPAEDVPWSITLEGTVFLNSQVSGTISSLPAGASADIGTGLILGIGRVDITVEAGGAFETASGLVLGPLVLGL